MWTNFGNKIIIYLDKCHIVFSYGRVVAVENQITQKVILEILCKDKDFVKKCITAIASGIASRFEELYIDEEFFA